MVDERSTRDEVVVGMRMTTRLGRDGFRWTLVDGGQGRRPVARGTCACADLAACMEAARVLLHVAPQATLPVRQDGGGWRRAVRGADGTVVAESVEVFDHPAACGYALHDLRHALARNGLDTDRAARRAPS